MSTTNPLTHYRAQVAAAVRAGDHVLADAVRQVLAEVKLERAIRDALVAAPPLTEAQRDRLAAILRESR